MSIEPGQIALTRTRRAAPSSAAVLVRFTTAALAAPYAPRPITPPRPAADAVLMIDPPPCAAITGSAARMP